MRPDAEPLLPSCYECSRRRRLLGGRRLRRLAASAAAVVIWALSTILPRRPGTPECAEDGGLHLEYHLFDWDDNVVYMPTKIWMQDASTGEVLALSTGEYARRRGDPGLLPLNGDYEETYREFRDGEGGGDFEGDLKRALYSPAEEWQGPAFGEFKETLIEGRLFAIITARGHSEATLRRSITAFALEILSVEERRQMIRSLHRFNAAAGCGVVSDEDAVSNYLQRCHFVGVSSTEFRAAHPNAPSTELRKKEAIRSFVTHIMQSIYGVFGGDMVSSISIVFSDDDAKNIATVEKFMRDELANEYPRVAWKLLDTGSTTRREIRIPQVAGLGG